MKIVIVGAGFTGIQLAKRLVNGKNDVVLIDNNDEVTRHASNQLDCDVFTAEGNNLANLEKVGIKEADALVCVTSSDEINMITCSLVDTVYPDVLKIARVRNYAYYVDTVADKKTKDNRPLYGIDYMIHPDVEAAEAMANAAKHGAVTDVIPFGDEYELIRLTLEDGCKLVGQPLKNVRKIANCPVLIAYVERDGETRLPSGDTVFEKDDCVGALLLKKDVESFLPVCGSKFKKIRKTAIVGAARIGSILAEKLIPKNNSLVSSFFNKKIGSSHDYIIIDRSEPKAKEASKKFPHTRVFCADACDESFIQEEKIGEFDLIICATTNYEMNIVMAAYLESMGVKYSIALVQNTAFGDIARKIGIEVAVPVRDTVVDSIMSHLKGKSVTSIHTVNEGSLAIYDIKIGKDSSVKGKMLKEIAESGKFLIMLMQKKDSEKYFIPVGDTILDEGDEISVVSTSDANQHILEKFGVEE